jgi:hypothetical protein
MAEIDSELRELARQVGGQQGHVHAFCQRSGVLAWRLLVVREMVMASPVHAASAASRLDDVIASLDAAMRSASWGRCSDMDEALTDMQTVLADMGDEVVPGRAWAKMPQG